MSVSEASRKKLAKSALILAKASCSIPCDPSAACSECASMRDSIVGTAKEYADEVVADRDREWSANLETGYDDCPPLKPDRVGVWLTRGWDTVVNIISRSERERLNELKSLPAAQAQMRAVLDCDEHRGPEGACECGRFAAARISEALDEENEACEKIADQCQGIADRGMRGMGAGSHAASSIKSRRENRK